MRSTSPFSTPTVSSTSPARGRRGQFQFSYERRDHSIPPFPRLKLRRRLGLRSDHLGSR